MLAFVNARLAPRLVPSFFGVAFPRGSTQLGLSRTILSSQTRSFLTTTRLQLPAAAATTRAKPKSKPSAKPKTAAKKTAVKKAALKKKPAKKVAKKPVKKAVKKPVVKKRRSILLILKESFLTCHYMLLSAYHARPSTS